MRIVSEAENPCSNHHEIHIPFEHGFKITVKYSKVRVKRPLKNRQNKDLYDKWQLNEGVKYCRMLPLEHSAILLTGLH